jgi:hypothetical protein
MGIIDHSITYTFFYAFPVTLLLLLFLPFYRAAYRGQPLQLSWPRALALMLLMVVLAFNGAIITGVVAVLFFGIGLHWISRQWQSLGPNPLEFAAVVGSRAAVASAAPVSARFFYILMSVLALHRA